MQNLRQVDPEVKAIISRGYADVPVMTEWRAFGFVAALPKPYSVDSLRETLEGILS